jgi:hypothetical protein
MLNALKFANLGLAFLLELCALAALAFWGVRTGNGLAMKIGLGVGTPLLAAVLWGTFMSPQAALPVPEPWHLVLTVVFFGLAVAGLFMAGRPTLGWTMGIVVAINLVLIAVWRQ